MPKFSFLRARAFDAGLAAMAAVSAGFVAFAMPESLFSSLVETSRLPDFVAAARPPLGETARLAAVGSAFLLTFAAVWALLAALSRLPASRKPEVRPDAEAPRLRRADAHPDAPARRPLLARDLGEPLDLEDFPEARAEEDPAIAPAEPRPLPAFLVPEAPQPEPVAQSEPEAEPAEAEWSEPEPLWTPSEPEWAEAEQAPEAEQPLPISKLAAQLPEAEEETDQSLSQLVNRIEFGLARKRQALPAADFPPAEEIQAEQEKVGHRLRSAINDLQKIASSGG
ncbi:MAG TPA: hypothetical protein VF535_08265 [Allosphingosinicella sp.]|jgi:hypothetical protein